jgi:NAD(P)-dependent dehydrogenase (short-subunit alcohol dehydrogenase family)
MLCSNAEPQFFWLIAVSRSLTPPPSSPKHVPLMRVGDTHTDIGAVVAFLISDEGSYLTNQTIHVDGGTGSFR